MFESFSFDIFQNMIKNTELRHFHC